MQSSNDIITYYTVETFAVFRNVDNSILKSNIFIEKYGFKFVSIELSELENKFSDLFSMPKNFKSDVRVLVQEPDVTVSQEFWQVLLNNNSFGHYVIQNREVIFLKRIENFEQEVINNTISISDSLKAANHIKKFVSNLIQQFRLFKNGDIDCPIQFQISKEKREVLSKLTSKSGNTYGENIYTLTDNEIGLLFNKFKEEFSTNTLTELALNNFNLSYEIVNIKTKYITLMTCLESLFNLGREQITHTVSRHLAIIISTSENEFKQNYKRIKELYRLRSAIVHGGTPNEDLHKATDELQNKVREAINYCLTIQLDKVHLFDKLNTFGFEIPSI